MFKKIQALAKGGKYAYETLVPKIKKNLAARRKTFEEMTGAVDKQYKNILLSQI